MLKVTEDKAPLRLKKELDSWTEGWQETAEKLAPELCTALSKLGYDKTRAL